MIESLKEKTLQAAAKVEGLKAEQATLGEKAAALNANLIAANTEINVLTGLLAEQGVDIKEWISEVNESRQAAESSIETVESEPVEPVEPTLEAV